MFVDMDTTLPDPNGDLLAPGGPITDDTTTEFPIDELPTASGASSAGTDRLADGWRRPDDAIIGGVAADLGARLGLDVLWVRLAFVVLLLVGGLGAFAYLGLWLTFVVGDDRPWARVAGGVILVAGVPLLIAQGDQSLATGPGAVVILLVGITLALWNRGAVLTPEVSAASGERGRLEQSRNDAAVHDTDGNGMRRAGVGAVAATRRRAVREPRVRRIRTVRPPSILGRTTLGAAFVVAGAGALVDELNGGRLHPEQWLGAGAVVCGLGLLIGTVRGHARWLLVPAVVFGLVGYAAGESAGLGLSLADAGGGDRYHYVDEGDPLQNRGISDASLSSVFGSMSIMIDAVPSEPARVDAVGVFGDVVVTTVPGVTIELVARADAGRVDIDGRSVGNGTHQIGVDPDTAGGSDVVPDVIIDARTVHGDISVFTYDPVPEFGGIDPTVIAPMDPSAGVEERMLGEGVRLLGDGTVILWDGQGLIGPDDEPLLGEWYAEDESRMVWNSEVGTWQLVGGVLVTPFGDVLDLDALRSGMLNPGPEVLLDSSNATTTVSPSTVPTNRPSSGTEVPGAIVPLTVVPGAAAPGDVPPATTIAQQEG